MHCCTENTLLACRTKHNMDEKKNQYDGGIVSQLGLMASFGSIFGSLYIYFISDDQMLGIFVGLILSLLEFAKSLSCHCKLFSYEV